MNWGGAHEEGRNRFICGGNRQLCARGRFANDEGANYCQRCGAFLAHSDPPPGTTTATYKLGETGELEELELDDVIERGPALVIRAGGGRAGEAFPLGAGRVTIGRRPVSDIFLDDVTVSRRHAEFYRSGSRFTVRDVGSLNGTYVNRERIEETDLTGGDEVQVGKFRLVFLLGPYSQAEHGGGGAQVGG